MADPTAERVLDRLKTDGRLNNMWKVTLKGLWGKKLRFISTMVAIVLGVGFMAGTFVLTDTIAKTFDDLFASVYKGTDAVVEPVEQVKTQFGVGTDRLPAATLDDGAHRRRCRARPKASCRGTRSSSSPTARPSAVKGHRRSARVGSTTPALNPLKVVTGHAPTTADEIAIDKNSLDSGKFHVGDTVKVLSPSPVKTYKIVGVIAVRHRRLARRARRSSRSRHRGGQRFFKTGGAFDAISIVAATRRDAGAVEDRMSPSWSPPTRSRCSPERRSPRRPRATSRTSSRASTSF